METAMQETGNALQGSPATNLPAIWTGSPARLTAGPPPGYGGEPLHEYLERIGAQHFPPPEQNARS